MQPHLHQDGRVLQDAEQRGGRRHHDVHRLRRPSHGRALRFCADFAHQERVHSSRSGLRPLGPIYTPAAAGLSLRAVCPVDPVLHDPPGAYHSRRAGVFKQRALLAFL